MKKLLGLAVLLSTSIQSSALEIIGTRMHNYVLITEVPDLKLICGIVLNDQIDANSNLVIKDLEKRNLEVTKTEIGEVESGKKNITFWIKDRLVRNLNCF